MWLNHPCAIFLLTPAILGFILALTNELHHQIWTNIRFTNGLPFGPLALTHGLGFFLLTAYLYVLLLLTTISFLQTALRTHGLSSYQAWIMLAGMFFPWVANLIYIGGLSPFPTIDLTPLALTFANVAISISFLRYRFMDIQPIAHSSVFNAMKDGVIVWITKNALQTSTRSAHIFFRTQVISLGARSFPCSQNGMNGSQ